MHVCIKIYVREAAYSLYCHEGAMINCRLYRTFQSLSVNRTETALGQLTVPERAWSVLRDQV